MYRDLIARVYKDFARAFRDYLRHANTNEQSVQLAVDSWSNELGTFYTEELDCVGQSSHCPHIWTIRGERLSCVGCDCFGWWLHIPSFNPDLVAEFWAFRSLAYCISGRNGFDIRWTVKYARLSVSSLSLFKLDATSTTSPSGNCLFEEFINLNRSQWD